MSDFEKFARSQGFSGDFQRGCNRQYKSDLLHFMEKAFMHQQAKIDAITKQRDSFIKAKHIAMNDVCEHKAKRDELKKKLDCCQDENKALLERLAVYDKHVKAIKHIHETQFDKNTDTSFILGNLDGFIEYLESDLKGNKDETGLN